MYQALYRVWRPKTFSEMVGQEAVVKTLRNQIMTGRIAHAYLFCGSRGTGKTSAAKIMAKAVNCLHPVNGDPCGECESCRTIENEASFDVYEMDAASNSRVEEIRDLLEKVEYPPQFGKYKVYIIDEVHMLSNAAFNALLKTLEEPPEYMVFILATTEPQKLLATILSRCQRFDFGRLTEREITGRLRQVCDAGGTQAEDEALSVIAGAAEGGMRDALSILDMCMGSGEKITESLVRQALGAADRSFLFDFADAVAAQDGARALKMVSALLRDGRDIAVFLKDFSEHLRLLIASGLFQGDAEALGVSDENAKRYVRQASFFSREKLLRVTDLCMKAEGDLRWASSGRSVLELFALRACEEPQEYDVVALLERIGEMENKLSLLEKNGIRAAAVPAEPVRTKPASESAAPEAPAQADTVPVGDKTPKEIWTAFLTTVKKEEAAIFSFVKSGRFGGYKDGTYRLLFESKDKGMIVFLSNPKRKERIEEILTSLGGKPAQFEAMSADQPEITNNDRQQEIIGTLTETFGRDKLQIDT